MPKRAAVLIAIATFGLAFTPHLVNAVTVPIAETTTTPAADMIQAAAAAVVSGTEQIFASIEAAVDKVAAVIADRAASVSLPNDTVSYTAAAAAPVASNAG